MRNTSSKTRMWATVAALGAMTLGAGGAASGKPRHAPPAPVTKSALEPQLFAVDQWWAIGGDGGGLKASMTACTQKLGEGHRPQHASVPFTTYVTKPMLDCLEGEGWHPAIAARPS
jgi:hypothetical protein